MPPDSSRWSQILGIAVALGLSYLLSPAFQYFNKTVHIPPEGVFTPKQLAEYNGENGAPLYLALLGSVYDVSKGDKHYGSGCTYNFFVGRDASVYFISGDFENFDAAISDDVLSLPIKDLIGLDTWQKFYEKQYEYQGKLVGRFYDADGESTPYHRKYLAVLKEAYAIKAAAERKHSQYPDCNIEWRAETGTRVWCTTASGGVHRDWVGYPRKLFEVGRDSFRCACVREEDLDSKALMLERYENCQRLDTDCYYTIQEENNIV